jgi:hypothetical protein
VDHQVQELLGLGLELEGFFLGHHGASLEMGFILSPTLPWSAH